MEVEDIMELLLEKDVLFLQEAYQSIRWVGFATDNMTLAIYMRGDFGFANRCLGKLINRPTLKQMTEDYFSS